VERTRSLQLPVYTDFRNGRTRIMTQLRRYSGDVEALRDEMSRILGGAEVVAHPGRLEVQGNHVAQLRMWLMGLGF
jgi:large subunit ribosomal protein L49